MARNFSGVAWRIGNRGSGTDRNGPPRKPASGRSRRRPGRLLCGAVASADDRVELGGMGQQDTYGGVRRVGERRHGLVGPATRVTLL